MKNKIVANKKLMSECLNTVAKALASKSLIPIFDGILLVIKDGVCLAYCRNQALQIKGRFPVEGEKNDNFSMCVPGRILKDTISLLSVEEITLEYDNQVLFIKVKRKKYKIPCFKAEDYIPMVTVAENELARLSLPSSVINQSMGIGSNIVVWDDLRPSLSGVSISNVEGKIEIYSMHGGSLFFRSITDISEEKAFGIILGREVCLAIKETQLSGDAELIVEEKICSFKSDGFEFISILINHEPSNIKKYYNYDVDSFISVNNIELNASLKRLSMYALSTKDSVKTIFLNINGEELTLSVEDNDNNKDASEVLDIVNNNTDNIQIAFNMSILSKPLGSITSDSIKLFLTGSTKPAFIEDISDSFPKQAWAVLPVDVKRKKELANG